MAILVYISNGANLCSMKLHSKEFDEIRNTIIQCGIDPNKCYVIIDEQVFSADRFVY
jgi:hypothetical protein